MTHKHKEKLRGPYSELINLIFDLSVMFLSLQIIFRLVKAAVVCAILDRISGFEPWFDIIAPRCLKVSTVFSPSPLAFMSVLMALGLFVNSWVFPWSYAEQLVSRCSISFSISSSLPARPTISPSAERKLVTVLPPILTVPTEPLS